MKTNNFDAIDTVYVKDPNFLTTVEPHVTDVMVLKSRTRLQDIVAITVVDQFGPHSSEVLRTYSIGKYTKESLEPFIGMSPEEAIRKLEQSQNESTELLALIRRLFADQTFEGRVIDSAYITTTDEQATLSTMLYSAAVNLCSELISEPWPNPYTIKVLSDAGFTVKRTFVMNDGYLCVCNEEKMLIYGK